MLSAVRIPFDIRIKRSVDTAAVIGNEQTRRSMICWETKLQQLARSSSFQLNSPPFNLKLKQQNYIAPVCKHLQHSNNWPINCSLCDKKGAITKKKKEVAFKSSLVFPFVGSLQTTVYNHHPRHWSTVYYRNQIVTRRLSIPGYLFK